MASYACGDYTVARAGLLGALAIVEDVHGEQHPTTAATSNDLGLVMRKLGHHERAHRHLRRALAIGEVALGPDDPSVAATLNNLGNVLLCLGRCDEAQQHYERALAIWTERLGPGHPCCARVTRNLELAREAKQRVEAHCSPRVQLRPPADSVPAGAAECASAPAEGAEHASEPTDGTERGSTPADAADPVRASGAHGCTRAITREFLGSAFDDEQELDELSLDAVALDVVARRRPVPRRAVVAGAIMIALFATVIAVLKFGEAWFDRLAFTIGTEYSGFERSESARRQSPTGPDA